VFDLLKDLSHECEWDTLWRSTFDCHPTSNGSGRDPLCPLGDGVGDPSEVPLCTRVGDIWQHSVDLAAELLREDIRADTWTSLE
jgi:hypothetical protein